MSFTRESHCQFIRVRRGVLITVLDVHTYMYIVHAYIRESRIRAMFGVERYVYGVLSMQRRPEASLCARGSD